MPKIIQTSPLIGAQTYIMQNFTLISDLASNLTSEAAFQSTRAISKSRLLWNDSISLRQLTLFMYFLLYFVLYFTIASIRHIYFRLKLFKELSRKVHKIHFCMGKNNQNLIKIGIVLFPIGCRNHNKATRNGESATFSFYFWILKWEHIKKWSKILGGFVYI